MLSTVKTRIQVSIHPELVQIAEDNMSVRKFSSFSAYLEMLIREEYTRGLAADSAARAAFMDHAAKTAPVNSAASPEFQAIFDAGVAAATARGAQGGKPLPVQSVSYLAPAQKGRKSPRKPLKK